MTESRLRFASRLSRIQASPTLQVLRRARELAAQGIDVIDFGPGEPDFITPALIREAAKAAIDAGFTKYTDSSGMPELRSALAASYQRRYGVSISPSQVIAGTGGKQELFNLMLAFLGPGDEAVIPSPYWVSFPQQVLLAGGTPVFAPLDARDGFRPTAEAIESALTEKTRLVILNSPSNPTGAVIRRDDLRDIVELCHSRNVLLIYDETYDYFVYDGEQHVSAAEWIEEFPETIVIVNSMSKTWAMTGWRLGFAIGHPETIRVIGNIQSHSTSNPSSIAQKAAIAALEGGEESIHVMLRAYQERREWLLRVLEEVPGFHCEPPGGAFYVFPRVSELYGREGVTDSVSFAAFLLEHARVAVVPGEAFGNDEHIRISYATSLETLAQGITRIREAIEPLRG